MSDSDSDLNEWVTSCTTKKIIANFKKTPLVPWITTSKAALDCSSVEESVPTSTSNQDSIPSEIQLPDLQSPTNICSVPVVQVSSQIDLTNYDSSSDKCLVPKNVVPEEIDLTNWNSSADISFDSFHNSSVLNNESNVRKTVLNKHRYNTRNKQTNTAVASVAALPIDEDAEVVCLNNSNANKKVGRGRRNAKRNKKTSNTIDFSSSIYGKNQRLNEVSENLTVLDTSNDKYIDEIQKENINYETNIKVVWKSINVIRIPIRRFQKLNDVFLHLMKLEKVPLDQIFLTFKGVPVKPSDTPDSLDLTICDFLEGGVVKKLSFSKSVPKKGPEYFLNFQYGDKKVIPLATNKNEPMQKLMLKFSEQIEKPLSSIRFQIDGDDIAGSDTPESLNLEKGEIIDVLL